MPAKIYKVKLTKEEREELRRIVKKGKVSGKKRRHAEILLKADECQKKGAWKDKKISEAFEVGTATVERIRTRFVEEGLEAALNGKSPNREKFRKFDGDKEARLIATACMKAPEGRSRWTLKMLADKMVELEIFESISTETIRQTLKKTKLNHG
jgi:transposase